MRTALNGHKQQEVMETTRQTRQATRHCVEIVMAWCGGLEWMDTMKS